METEVNQKGTSAQEVADRLVGKWNEAEVEAESPPAKAAPEPQEEVTEGVTESQDEVLASDDAEPTDEPEQVEEETSFNTIYELAEALEQDPEDFLSSIKARVKVNGEESEVSLSEALKGYQLEADYRRKTAELADQRREAEQAREEINRQAHEYQDRMSDLSMTADLATQTLMAEYNGIDWNRLREEDQTEYLIRQQDYNARMNQIQQAKQAMAQQAAEVHQKQISEILPKELNAVRRAIPEWDNEDTMKAEQKQVSEYLITSGYSKDEIANLYDHKAVVIARKAMLYDMAKSKHNTQSEPGKKVVKKVTKILKSGARKQATTVKEESIKKARQRLKKTGKTEDAVATLLSRWS